MKSMSSLLGFAIKLVILCLSILFAWFVVKAGHLDTIIQFILPFKYVAAVAVGVLYTSIFTTPFAMAGFYLLAPNFDPLTLAAVGGIGAVVGDLVILKFFRKLLKFIPQVGIRNLSKVLGKVLKRKHHDTLAIILGCLFIMLPLPDEVGLLMLGATRLSDGRLIILSYILNSVGILLLLLPLQLI